MADDDDDDDDNVPRWSLPLVMEGALRPAAAAELGGGVGNCGGDELTISSIRARLIDSAASSFFFCSFSRYGCSKARSGRGAKKFSFHASRVLGFLMVFHVSASFVYVAVVNATLLAGYPWAI